MYPKYACTTLCYNVSFLLAIFSAKQTVIGLLLMMICHKNENNPTTTMATAPVCARNLVGLTDGHDLLYKTNQRVAKKRLTTLDG